MVLKHSAEGLAAVAPQFRSNRADRTNVVHLQILLLLLASESEVSSKCK